MKKTIQHISLRLFGYDPYYEPKEIRYCGIWKVTIPDESIDTPELFNNWAKQTFTQQTQHEKANR